MSRSLKDVRVDIDDLDRSLQALINQRALLAQEAAKLKREAGESPDRYYHPAREAELLREVISRQSGPISPEAMARLFREVMSACLAIETRLRVGFLGPEETYTHIALERHFGGGVDAISCSDIESVFHQVVINQIDYGVVPLENMSEGLISQTLNALASLHRSSHQSSPVTICGEVQLHIRHTLLGAHMLVQGDSVRFDEVDKVYAHPQSLAQCRRWLDQRLPHAERVSTASNALAASLASRSDTSVAIASERAGSRYQLSTLATGLEDHPHNVTRFIVFGRARPRASGLDRTIALIDAEQRDLLTLLAPLSRRGVEALRISTHQASRGAQLLIDMRGHVRESPLRDALNDLADRGVKLHVLGSYPEPDLVFQV